MSQANQELNIKTLPGWSETHHYNRKPKNALFSLWFLKFMYNQNITNTLAKKWEIEFQCSFFPHHIQDAPL